MLEFITIFWIVFWTWFCLNGVVNYSGTHVASVLCIQFVVTIISFILGYINGRKNQ